MSVRMMVRQQSLDDTQLQPIALGLIMALLLRLEQQSIRYCYWKRSTRVGQALEGDKDLDLLIARSDQHRAEQVLLECGFKRFPSVFNRDHPAVSSFLGFDEPSGKIVHVHAHLRLIVGEPLLKNYRLPWEDSILARAVRHPSLIVRILDPAAEALLMMVRACLELRRLDPIMLRTWASANDLARADLEDLARHVKPELLHELAEKLLDRPAADRMVEALYAARPLQQCRRMRSLLLRHIGCYRLYNAGEARIRAIGRGLLWAAGSCNKHYLKAPRPWSRRAPGAGCVIAVVGLDGSGKSTVVGTLRRWLLSEVDVMPIYFGTGEGRPSLTLLPFKLLVPFIEPLFKQKPSGSSHGNVTKRAPGLLYSLCMTVWATIVAAEKRGKLVAARRAASRGMVVVADRYPQNEILRFNDGPLLPRLPKVPGPLRRYEQTAYLRAQQMPPDLVLKLVVTPATAARREPTMDRAVIAERVVQLDSLAFPGARVVAIDAEQPLDDVIRAAKRHVWNAL